MIKAEQIPNILNVIGAAEARGHSWVLRFDGTCVEDRAAKKPEAYNWLSLALDLRRAAAMGVRVGMSPTAAPPYRVAVTDVRDNHTVYTKEVCDVATGLCQALNKTMLNRLRLQVGLPKL